MNKILKISLSSLIVAGMCMAFAACGGSGEGGGEQNGSTATHYTVTFDANGGNYSDGATTSQTTTDDSGKVTLPADPSRDEYVFGGYNTTADGTGSAVTSSYVYTADTTVYAQWTASSEEQPETPSTGTSEYYFEAEYTDLTNLTGDLGSGTSYNKDMITEGELAHGGYYVANFNIVDSTITYTINSDVAAKANLSLLLTLESEDTVDGDLLKITVNGSAVSFDSTKITPEKQQVSVIKSNIVFQTLEIGEVDLVAGENTIVLAVGSKSNASGTGTYKLTFHMDALVLETDAALTWNPITDWDSYYPSF